MQFVANGPDLPDSLVQAHEEGRVVFFCGAGISYPAGLPSFKGLVDAIYERVGTTRTAMEQEAYERNQFDATLDLLERRLPGQRIAVRHALAQALQPKLRRKGAGAPHAALLQLARCRDGGVRLVTTNFDRIFEKVGTRLGKGLHAYAAPMLPIPKNSRWDGLVYLHGQLPDKADDSALHRLVLTSGDFGLAYLTERWAARFVSELFRNYVVCFVGYSINDPVLRYMMDALAADRMLGEITPQAYALGDCESGREGNKTVEWKAKGVTPILYEVPTGSDDHSALYRTLTAWAETYRDGILGKERIVVDYALARPSASTRQDDFVGRMLWALSHESGLPAKRFAEFNPAPALEWLEVFSDDRNQQGDLNRFGVLPRVDVDDKLRFSLIHRPAPYRQAPWMALVSGGFASSQWDNVVFHLARWLTRHLNDPALIVWLAQRGGQLHDRLSWQIEQELGRFAGLEREGKTRELDEIRTNAPNAIPGPLMQVLWRLLLTGRVKSPWRQSDIYRWTGRLKRNGVTTTLRLELRELLAPKVTLREPFRWESKERTVAPDRVKQLVDWELSLATDHVHAALGDLSGDHWHTALPSLLDDFQLLLRDALDLLRELGEADDLNDRSHWDLPSISPHWQNRGFHDWVTLIEMLRDAWLATRDVAPARASRLAVGWFNVPYPTFKRLALFAASQEDTITPAQWVKWLVMDDARWLWSLCTQREAMRLIVMQGAKLSSSGRATLENAILAGPPRHMYREDIEPERWQSLMDRSVWLLLAKLCEGGSQLGDSASNALNNLSTKYPKWQLAGNERDKFSHWMSGTGDPDFEASREVDFAPRKRAELVRWLKQPSPERRPLHEDTWRETCRTRFFHSLLALCDLAKEGLWPRVRWSDALQAWSEESRISRSWRYAAPLVQSMPDVVVLENVHSVTWWVEAASKSIECHELILLDLCRRVLALPLEANTGIQQNSETIDQPVTEAINHPIGHVTQALLDFWFRHKPGDNDLLPEDIKFLLTQLCDVGVARFRHGRVLLASRLIALFRADQFWTEKYLLPLFDWGQNSAEANAVWEGFLWSPRLYRPLLIAFKSQLLSTAHHYADLGEHGRQFSAFLTYAALDTVDGYTPEDFRTAIEVMPQAGLQEVAQTLSQALEGAGEQRAIYWKNRIKPFWQRIWPKSRELASSNIAESLARLCIAASDEFPSALLEVGDWLRPIEQPDYVVHLLHESNLSGQFPEAALRFLDAIIIDQLWSPAELRLCLNAIEVAMPSLQRDRRHQRLIEFVRRRGV